MEMLVRNEKKVSKEARAIILVYTLANLFLSFLVQSTTCLPPLLPYSLSLVRGAGTPGWRP